MAFHNFFPPFTNFFLPSTKIFSFVQCPLLDLEKLLIRKELSYCERRMVKPSKQQTSDAQAYWISNCLVVDFWESGSQGGTVWDVCLFVFHKTLIVVASHCLFFACSPTQLKPWAENRSLMTSLFILAGKPPVRH